MKTAENATDDKIYQVEFRAWQLEAIRDYIISLEAQP
jgi:hypothetical protein